MDEVPFRWWYADAERDFWVLWRKAETKCVLCYLDVPTLDKYIEFVLGMKTFFSSYWIAVQLISRTDIDEEAIVAVITSVHHLAQAALLVEHELRAGR